jgi:hypothetical protein
MHLLGDSVFYPALQRYGTVRKIINLGDKKDIALQGYRYEVFFRSTGWTYSVPARSLTTSKIRA